MMRIGIIGFGFMGRMHFDCWTQQPDADVVAVCDANPEVVSAVHETIGNIPGLPEHFDLSGVRFYTDAETMLAESQLDAVSITLPTWLHADLTCRSLRAGVHVLCEKPMALDVGQCERMIAAARDTDKKLMVAHCIRFWPEYAETRRIVRSGKYGSVRAANFQRLSARPAWSSENWLMDAERSGGMAMDLHIHDTDYIQFLFGMPAAVRSRTVPAGAANEHIKTDYLYDSDMLITAEGSWLASDAFGFRMNFEIFLEKATIVYDSSRSPGFQIFPDGGKPLSPELPPGDGYFHEIRHFCDWIQEKTHPVITPEQSMDSIRIVHAEMESASTQQTINIQPYHRNPS